MHCMAISGHLKVQEGQLHMFLGTLADGSTVIRSAARRVLRSTRLNKSAMFKLCFEGLERNLELYPQDEADVFSVLFVFGGNHGKFVVDIIQEAPAEIEPSFGGSLGFENARTVALLVLAISAPVSVEQSICTIPPRLFSYAVTLLGRISCGLIGPLSMNALLAYLSHCSQFTYVSLSEFFEGKGPTFPLMEYNMQLQTESYGFHETLQKILEAKKVAHPFLAYQLEKHEEATSYAKIILENVKDVWPLIQYGRMDDVSRTLRSWKKELMTVTSDSLQSSAELAFTLQYLRIIKLLGQVWSHCMFSMRTCSSVTGELEILLKKLHRSLIEIRHSFVGLSKEEDLHILELILLRYAMEISCVRACSPSATLKKLYSTVCCIEHLSEGSSFELSTFTIELQKMWHEIGPLTEESVENLFQLQKSLESYSLRQFVLSGTLKHVKAKLEVCNSHEHPLCFISGLPVGIAFEIKLYNMLSASRLWLKMTLEEKDTQFVFLDLDGVSGSDEIRELTFVAPFYRTPRASCFILKVCIVMECSTELVHQFNNVGGPKHEFLHLCKDKEVYLSRMVK